jgi:hypothetical protein
MPLSQSEQVSIVGYFANYGNIMVCIFANYGRFVTCGAGGHVGLKARNLTILKNYCAF